MHLFHQMLLHRFVRSLLACYLSHAVHYLIEPFEVFLFLEILYCQ